MSRWTGRLAEILEALPADDAAAVNFALCEGVPAEWIAMVLTKNGYQVSASTIRTQRRTTREVE